MPQKNEREIDEILRRMDTFLPEEPMRRRLRRSVGNWLAAVSPRLGLKLTAGRLMVAGLALVLLSYLLRAAAPALTTPAGLLALACFVGALVLSVARARRRPAMGWRGRSLDYYRPNEGLVWQDWLRRWRAWRRGKRRGPRY